MVPLTYNKLTKTLNSKSHFFISQYAHTRSYMTILIIIFNILFFLAFEFIKSILQPYTCMTYFSATKGKSSENIFFH